MIQARVRPHIGELKLLRLDNLPSQRSDGMFKFLSAPAVPAAVGPSVGIIGAT